MIFSKLKMYAAAAVVFLLTTLAVIAKYFQGKASREKRKRRAAEAHRDHVQKVAKADKEISQQTKSRRADALNEIKQKGHSDLLSDPSNSKHWMHDSDSD